MNITIPSNQANKQTNKQATETQTQKRTNELTHAHAHMYSHSSNKRLPIILVCRSFQISPTCFARPAQQCRAFLRVMLGRRQKRKRRLCVIWHASLLRRSFSQLLHNSKKQSDQRIIAQFLDALLQKDSEKADFFAKDVVGHAKTVHPLFDPNGCSIHDLQDALQALCSNILADEDDPVNVDDEGRPVVRLMGSTNGLKIVEAARAIFKNRRTELTMAESLNSIEESLKKMQALDATCFSLSEQKESMLEVHNFLQTIVAMKKKPALIQQRHDVLQKEWTEHLANVQMWDLYSVAGVGLKRVLGSELGDGDEEIDAEEAK